MTELLTLTVLGNIGANVLASAVGGGAMALRAGRPRWHGSLLGGLLPWLGLLILAAMTARQRRVFTYAPARKGLGRAGVALLVLGGAAVLVSAFGEGIRVGVTAMQVRQSVAWAGVMSPEFIVSIAVVAGLFAGLGVGAWRHGGLRFTLLAAMLTTFAATLFVDLVIVAGLVSELIRQSEGLTGGTVRLSLLLGWGGWLALIGCVGAYVGSVFLLLRRPALVVAPVVPSPAPGASFVAPPPWGSSPGAGTPGGWSTPQQPLNDGW